MSACERTRTYRPPELDAGLRTARCERQATTRMTVRHGTCARPAVTLLCDGHAAELRVLLRELGDRANLTLVSERPLEHKHAAGGAA